MTPFEVQVAREFAETVAGILQQNGVPRAEAIAEIPAMSAAILELVADGAIQILEDGILIRDASRLEAIIAGGVPKR